MTRAIQVGGEYDGWPRAPGWWIIEGAVVMSRRNSNLTKTQLGVKKF